MFPLKPISRDSTEGALAKAERYRLLNEPTEAESICRDILEIDPGNAAARISLILALTDQISHYEGAFSDAVNAIAALESPYDRAYYLGIAWERRAKAFYEGRLHGSAGYVYEWLVKALGFFEQAERIRPPANDDAILRWNACVRFLACHRELGPKREEAPDPILSE